MPNPTSIPAFPLRGKEIFYLPLRRKCSSLTLRGRDRVGVGYCT